MSEWMEELDVVYGAWRVQLKMDDVLVRRRTNHYDILVFENQLFGRVLALDGIVQTTERDEFVFHEMLVHVPLFAHGGVRDVLIIGGGDGGVLKEVLKHKTVKTVTVVEIDRGVIECCRQHLTAVCGQAFDDPRTNIVFGDGVSFVASGDRDYDLILVDSTDPVGPGAALFDGTFYANCADRLRPGGILVSQFGVPFAEPEWLARPYLRLQDAFAATACYLVPVPANYGGFLAICLASQSAESQNVAPEQLKQRFQDAGISTKYYTPDMHKASFALPPYVTEILG